MKLYGYHHKLIKVRGPMGVYEEERMFPTGGEIDLPIEEAHEMKKMRHPHPHGGYVKFHSEDEVDEGQRLGLTDAPAPAAAPSPRARAAAKE